jgi:hypothetical protein
MKSVVICNQAYFTLGGEFLILLTLKPFFIIYINHHMDPRTRP